MGGADSSGSVRHRGKPLGRRENAQNRVTREPGYAEGVEHGEMDYGTDKWPARLLYSKVSVDASVAA